MLLKLICAAIGTALFGLGYYAGRAADRRRIDRMSRPFDDQWDEPTQPAIEVPRPRFVAPVIDLEAMGRIERAVMPRRVRVNCSTRGSA